MTINEQVWEIYLDHVEHNYKDVIKFPIKDHFHRANSLLIFDPKLELDEKITDHLSFACGSFLIK